jgi:hypothetical protein
MKMIVFWDVSSCSLAKLTDVSEALTLKTVSTFATSIDIHETTGRNIPED